MEIRVKLPEPPSGHSDKLLTQMDHAFKQVTQTLAQQGKRHERMMTQMHHQQGRMLTSLERVSRAPRPSHEPELNGMAKMLSHQWQAMVKLLKASKSSFPYPVPPPKTSVRVVVPPIQKPTMTASPALLGRFDAMTEAIRKMRPRTYGIMR